MPEIKFTVPYLMRLDHETPDGRLIESAGFKGIQEGQTAKTYALDQQGVGGHLFARIVGELTEISIADDGVVSGRGWIMADDFGVRVANLIENGLLVGASVDLADDYVVQYVEEYDSEAGEWKLKIRFTESALAGFTLVEKPAFPDAHVVLDEPLPDEYKFSLSPASEHFEECTDCPEDEPCGPCAEAQARAQAKAAAIEQELQTIIASAQSVGSFVRVRDREWAPPETLVYPDSIFERRDLRRLTPFQHDPATGQIFGHLAGWKSCHGALPECVTPPRSNSGYRYFANVPVTTKSGAQVWVGRLVCNTVHAKIRGISAEQAMAHYSTTGSVFGLVAIGEDEHGIWVSGAAVQIDPQMLSLALACPPSGDWRRWYGLNGRELIAGLAVPVPGFNTPQAEFAGEGEQTGLIVSNVPVDTKSLETGSLDASILSKLDKVVAFVEREQEREQAEARRRRIADLAAAFAR